MLRRENGASQNGDVAVVPFFARPNRKFRSSSFFASESQLHENACYAAYVSNWVDEFEKTLKSMNLQPPHWLCYSLCCKLQNYSYCGRQKEPTILISRLLLRMRSMYVANIH